MKEKWNTYNPHPFYDELIAAQHQPRRSSYKLVDYLRNFSPAGFKHCVDESEAVIREMGITFTVYSDAGNIDRSWPLYLSNYNNKTIHNFDFNLI